MAFWADSDRQVYFLTSCVTYAFQSSFAPDRVLMESWLPVQCYECYATEWPFGQSGSAVFSPAGT